MAQYTSALVRGQTQMASRPAGKGYAHCLFAVAMFGSDCGDFQPTEVGCALIDVDAPITAAMGIAACAEGDFVIDIDFEDRIVGQDLHLHRLTRLQMERAFQYER